MTKEFLNVPFWIVFTNYASTLSQNHLNWKSCIYATINIFFWENCEVYKMSLGNCNLFIKIVSTRYNRLFMKQLVWKKCVRTYKVINETFCLFTFTSQSHDKIAIVITHKRKNSSVMVFIKLWRCCGICHGPRV